MSKSSEDYWRAREEEQRKHNIEEEKAYQKEIDKIYKQMVSEIDKQIYAFYAKYASQNAISMAEAKKRADKLDIEAYAEKAKKYVKEKNFSTQANREMKIYNLTMKANRLDLLKAQLGLELCAGSDEIQSFMEEKLEGRTLEEIERQAGILGKSVLNNKEFAHSLVNASFHNATFSDRIWAQQANLRNELSNILTNALIAGRNPRDFIPQIRKRFDVTRSQANRLLVTELARVQTEAQMQSFKRNGFDEYTFLALGTACEVCKRIDGKHFKVEKANSGINMPPMHPNCRCSTSAYMDDEDYEAWLNSYKDHGLTWDEWRLQRKELSITNSLLSVGEVIARFTEVSNLKKNLNVSTKALYKVPSNVIKTIHKGMGEFYSDFPSMRNFIKSISYEEPQDKSIAQFRMRWNKGKIETSLLINPKYFSDEQGINKIVERNVKAGYWTPKEGVVGLIKHEMGHALEAYLLFKSEGVEPFIISSKEKENKKRYDLLLELKSGKLSTTLVKRAFYRLGIPPTSENVGEYISGYAKKYLDVKGNYQEAFAEIISDNRKGSLYNILNEIIRELGVL